MQWFLLLEGKTESHFNWISVQVAAVSAFAQTLRRYTSLNHLAQAARAVLQNTSQINQMLNDLNRVDFANVQVLCVLAKCVFEEKTLNFFFLIRIIIFPFKVTSIHRQHLYSQHPERRAFYSAMTLLLLCFVVQNR